MTRVRPARPRYFDQGMRRPPAAFVDSVVAIATVSGAWCPSLSPAGDRVAYITDRSGVPAVEVGPTSDLADGLTERVSGPGQEAISVAWSPDGNWLTYLVSPGGSIRAELHAVRPDGSGRRRLAGGGETETVFAGLWTQVQNRYAFTIADGRSPNASVWFVDVVSGELEELASSVGIGFCTVTSVSADGGAVVVRCGPRNRRRLLILDVAGARPPLPVLRRDFPDGSDTGEDGRFAPDNRLGVSADECRP